ncbi:MAG TPA: hypothetical protein VHZ96_21250 [Frankiaceae bacterium]|jgi:hypothetical protein|nr:hypothetical protein [Frankiaceae bacterium]
MTDKIDDETTVRALLQMAGVTPTEEEITGLVAGFAGTRAMVDALYKMPGVRYEEPAVIFHARP